MCHPSRGDAAPEAPPEIQLANDPLSLAEESI
jgi:hypothetical protein